ncbi:MAG: CoA ester lyase [Chloroflexi bacterium]|nr:CoA ester lyase [Chloroflexota bacterium]
MHPRRALLYMPGDDWNKINKAITLHVDSICMDMEDGTALNRKVEARETIAKALQELKFGKSEKLARINAVGSGLEKDDIETVLPCHPDGVVIPKVESFDQIQWASEIIETAELANGWDVNSIRVLVGIETARGIINLKEIASHPRLDGLIFGAEDFAANIGATRSRAGWEVLHARSSVVLHAAAYSLQAIDMVTIDFRDTINLKIEAAQGAALGYSGKQIIHPAQVQPVQEAFTPSDDVIDYAKRVVETFEAHQAEGAGAYELDGKMIDMPLLKNAQKVLDRARAAGKV